MTNFACPFWLINSGLCSWTSHSTKHGDILAGNSPQNKITIHFPQGSLAAVQHLAVNQDSTKMRHSWTQWQTTAAPHSTTIGFTQGDCKKTAFLIYFYCKQWLHPQHSIWLERSINNALNTLHDHNTWFHSSTFSKHSKRILKALMSLEKNSICTCRVNFKSLSTKLQYLIIKSCLHMHTCKYGWLQAEMVWFAFEVLILQDLISKLRK